MTTEDSAREVGKGITGVKKIASTEMRLKLSLVEKA